MIFVTSVMDCDAVATVVVKLYSRWIVVMIAGASPFSIPEFRKKIMKSEMTKIQGVEFFFFLLSGVVVDVVIINGVDDEVDICFWMAVKTKRKERSAHFFFLKFFKKDIFSKMKSKMDFLFSVL